MDSDYLRIRTALEAIVSDAVGHDVPMSNLLYVNCSNVGYSVSPEDSSDYVSCIRVENIDVDDNLEVVVLDASGLRNLDGSGNNIGIRNENEYIGDDHILPIHLNFYRSSETQKTDFLVYVICDEADTVALYAHPSVSDINQEFTVYDAYHEIFRKSPVGTLTPASFRMVEASDIRRKFTREDSDTLPTSLIRRLRPEEDPTEPRTFNLNDVYVTTEYNRDYILVSNRGLVQASLTDQSTSIDMNSGRYAQSSIFYRENFYLMSQGLLNPNVRIVDGDSSLVMDHLYDASWSGQENAYLPYTSATPVQDMFIKYDVSVECTKDTSRGLPIYLRPGQAIKFSCFWDCSNNVEIESSTGQTKVKVLVSNGVHNYDDALNKYGDASALVTFTKDLNGANLSKGVWYVLEENTGEYGFPSADSSTYALRKLIV